MVRSKAAGSAVGQRRRRTQSGFSLVELIVAFSILLVLSSLAVPLARYQVRRQREKDLLEDLRDMRHAIDKYKDLCDQGKIPAGDPDTFCYPPKLEVLVDGVKMSNKLSANGGGDNKIKFLRKIPTDPFTGDTDWGFRSMQDAPTSNSWGGQNVFNVYTKAMDRTADGKPYSEW
jgi:general secretion pathway protein G